MSSAALLEVRNLGKRFTGRQGREPLPWIIQGLSFSVGEGEFLTIVGPSGSGKTTLLNMIALVVKSTARLSTRSSICPNRPGPFFRTRCAASRTPRDG